MFKLISDTSCDWIKEYAEEHNVTLVPLYTTFDGQTYYKEQFEISYDEFYRKMTDENAFPKSSLPSIQDYVDAFMPSVEAGVPIICCCITTEIAFSCPRLRPIINNDRINPKDVHEAQLLQVVTAYRLFMPFASITVSTRECARVRDNLMNIAATKISAGVSTGIGSHSEDIEEKDRGDEQFEISDGRDVKQVYDDLVKIGLQPVMSDYIYCG